MGSGFDFELCRELRHRFAEAVFQMDRPSLVFADADGAARIGLVQCFLEFFRIGTLEIAEVRHLIAFIEGHRCVAVVAFFRRISRSGLAFQGV